MGGIQGFRQITLDEWLYWKEDIRDKLRETAGNFVHVGYRLKQIRDSGMYGGAADIFEFAQREYGLGKSTVSRFIAINEKFSEGGNSLELKAEYRDIGSSKLSEMLTLPDAECSLITERTTVKEIRDLKSFLRQEPPGEPAAGMEEAAGDPEEQGQTEAAGESRGREGDPMGLLPLRKCLAEYFLDKKELLNDVVPLIYGDKYPRAAELINPSGYSTYKKGLVFIFMYDISRGVRYKVFGQPEISAMTWERFLGEIYDIYGSLYEAGEDDVHGAFYRKAPDTAHENSGKARQNLDLEPSVATSQQGQEAGGRLLSGTEGCRPEEALLGQMEVADYPGTMPEGGHTEPEGSHGSRAQEVEDAETDNMGTDAGKEEAADRSGREPAQGDRTGAGHGGVPADGKVQGPDEGGGAPQGGGRGADPWERIKGQSHTEIWEEIAAAQKVLDRFIRGWNSMDPSAFPKEHLEEAYRNAVDLAAALEKLMIVRGTDGEVDNAQ